MEEKFGELTLSESKEEVTIEFDPFNNHVPEKEILEYMIHVHEHYFQWKCVKGRIEIFKEIFKGNKSGTFVRSRNEKNSFEWTNKTPIDLTGLSSVHRILVIRDITEHLRKLNASRDEANKMLTESVKTTIKFKLEDITFSLILNPTVNQPGNAFFTMARIARKFSTGKHSDVEDFDCFKNLDPKDIESIVRNARKTGKKITDSDIKNSKQDEDRVKMAEEMNFFMLLYDFEVARRLQRPFTEESRNLDSLPIGIGIAMIHLINGLFQGDSESRKRVLDDILVRFNEPSRSWTEGDLIKILCEQFDSHELSPDGDTTGNFSQ
ncbi:hypothetical protein OUZ56_014424 [Daphnia magna]|uniref:Uncharacterized protein n=1 Tax=Daphnia magna TaxID=35525 RepID=A0ABR0AJS0_9CRUS|nr:hypothetical protein OUZ56_014424 [Daphnia magna]